MREIKFRAWDKKELCFVNPENLVIRADCGAIFDREHDIELHHIDLMQYAGLKDKNGKEIYEDDVVNWFMEVDNQPDSENKPIVFDEYWGQWYWGNDGGNTQPLSELDTESIEIRGNIYENPELIK